MQKPASLLFAVYYWHVDKAVFGTNIFITYGSFFYRVLINPVNDRHIRVSPSVLEMPLKYFVYRFRVNHRIIIYIHVVRTLVRIGCKRTNVRITIATLKFLNVNVNLRDE